MDIDPSIIISSLALIISMLSFRFGYKSKRKDEAINYLEEALAARKRALLIKQLHSQRKSNSEFNIDNKNSDDINSAIKTIHETNEKLDRVIDDIVSYIDDKIENQRLGGEINIFSIKVIRNKLEEIEPYFTKA